MTQYGSCFSDASAVLCGQADVFGGRRCRLRQDVAGFLRVPDEWNRCRLSSSCQGRICNNASKSKRKAKDTYLCPTHPRFLEQHILSTPYAIRRRRHMYLGRLQLAILQSKMQPVHQLRGKRRVCRRSLWSSFLRFSTILCRMSDYTPWHYCRVSNRQLNFHKMFNNS